MEQAQISNTQATNPIKSRSKNKQLNLKILLDKQIQQKDKKQLNNTNKKNTSHTINKHLQQKLKQRVQNSSINKLRSRSQFQHHHDHSKPTNFSFYTSSHSPQHKNSLIIRHRLQKQMQKYLPQNCSFSKYNREQKIIYQKQNDKQNIKQLNQLFNMKKNNVSKQDDEIIKNQLIQKQKKQKLKKQFLLRQILRNKQIDFAKKVKQQHYSNKNNNNKQSLSKQNKTPHNKYPQSIQHNNNSTQQLSSSNHSQQQQQQNQKYKYTFFKSKTNSQQKCIKLKQTLKQTIERSRRKKFSMGDLEGGQNREEQKGSKNQAKGYLMNTLKLYKKNKNNNTIQPKPLNNSSSYTTAIKSHHHLNNHSIPPLPTPHLTPFLTTLTHIQTHSQQQTSSTPYLLNTSKLNQQKFHQKYTQLNNQTIQSIYGWCELKLQEQTSDMYREELKQMWMVNDMEKKRRK